MMKASTWLKALAQLNPTCSRVRVGFETARHDSEYVRDRARGVRSLPIGLDDTREGKTRETCPARIRRAGGAVVRWVSTSGACDALLALADKE